MTTSLCLFFTRGVSLRNWVESGIFDREVKIYHAHIDTNFFYQIYWLTYGADDAEVANKLYDTKQLSKKIKIIPCPKWICNTGRISSILYSLLLPIIAKKIIAKCDVLKTNQMEGSIPAIICSIFWRRPLYIRTGYTLSRVIEMTAPNNHIRRIFAYVNEYLAFKYASASSVSSKYDYGYIIQRYGTRISPPKIVGNYVDTTLFSTHGNQKKITNRLIYVGRLSAEKNIDNAIVACAKIGIGIDIAGTGPELKRLISTAKYCSADIKWLGSVPNNKLANIINKYQYFILPSSWEGMPKALMEAMSAGLVCIGNNTTGINELIIDGITGYLTKSPDVKDISETIIRALNSDSQSISKAARMYVCSKFSLESIVKKETEIFSSIIK